MTAALPPWLATERETRGVGHLLDYTLLRPDATEDDVLRLCDAAVAAGTYAVCVNGGWVVAAAGRLRGTGIRVAAVIGFPLGAGAGAAKAAEAALAVADGATELDMVAPLGAVKAADWAAVTADVAQVAAAAGGALLKVIVESAALDPGELPRACRAAVAGGGRFVKTSTGFHPAGGASIEAVRLMRATVGPGVGVKASGGVRTSEQVLALLAAGANRVGLSGLGGIQAILGPQAPPLAVLLAGSAGATR